MVIQTRKKLRAILCLTLSIWLTCSLAYANPIAQTLQINTHFRHVTGNPVWLIELRDVDSGVVTPYMFDIKNDDNFWLALNYGRNYVVTASTLKFGPFAVIHNFCHLQNGVLSGKSMIITLSGDLTPSPVTFNCHVLKYQDNNFTVVTPDT